MTEKEVIKRNEGVSIRLKMKRGSGTNDRDEVKAKVHAETLSEASQKADEAEQVMDEKMEQLRNNQYDNDS